MNGCFFGVSPTREIVVMEHCHEAFQFVSILCKVHCLMFEFNATQYHGYLGEDGFHLICGSEAGRGHKSVQIWRIARSGAVLEYKAG